MVRFHSSVLKSTFRNNCGKLRGGRAKGKSVEAKRINHYLDNIRIQIGKHDQSICDHDAYVMAEKAKNAYLGMGEQ